MTIVLLPVPANPAEYQVSSMLKSDLGTRHQACAGACPLDPDGMTVQSTHQAEWSQLLANDHRPAIFSPPGRTSHAPLGA